MNTGRPKATKRAETPQAGTPQAGTPQAGASRPLRADAARNRARIVEAATELFAERGLEVTLDDVAAHAGVGVGTVYRRFANRDELIVGVFVDHLENVTARVRAVAADSDPWDSVVLLIMTVGEEMASDRGLASILTEVDHSDPSLVQAKGTIETLVGEIIERARSAKVIRPDLANNDFFGVVCMLAAIGDVTRGTGGAWRRFAELILDGLRADGPRVPLTTPPLTDDQLQTLNARKAEALRSR